MKKYIFRVFSLLAISTLVFASCSEKPLSKAAVDAEYSGNPANIPTVTIGEPSLDAKGQTISVAASFATEGTVIEAGFEFSTAEDFNADATKYVKAEYTAGGIAVSPTLGALTTYYIRSYVVVFEGTAYSASKSITTKDLPFHEKVLGTFTAKVVSEAYGDEYTSTIVVAPYPDDVLNKVIVGNLEPYYEASKAVYPKNNFIIGTLDEANQRIVLPLGANMGLGTRQLYGFNNKSSKVSTATSDVYLDLKNKGTELYRLNAFGVLVDGGLEDLYLGDVTYKKK